MHYVLRNKKIDDLESQIRKAGFVPSTEDDLEALIGKNKPKIVVAAIPNEFGLYTAIVNDKIKCYPEDEIPWTACFLAKPGVK